MPGNIRRAEHFCSFLRQLVHYMQERISVNNVEQESCTIFLAALQEQMSVDGACQKALIADLDAAALSLTLHQCMYAAPCLDGQA